MVCGRRLRRMRGHPLSAGPRTARRYSACTQPGAGADLHRGVLLLHPDGGAERAPGGVLHRPGDPADAWCGDAVGAAGECVHQPAVLGNAGRSHRRAARRVGGIGLSGGGDRRVSADAERGRAVRCRPLRSVSASPASSRLMSSRCASCSRPRKRPGASRRSSSSACRGMAFGSWLAGELYDHFGFYAPAFGVGVLFNLANLLRDRLSGGATGRPRAAGLRLSLMLPLARAVLPTPLCHSRASSGAPDGDVRRGCDAGARRLARATAFVAATRQITPHMASALCAVR